MALESTIGRGTVSKCLRISMGEVGPVKRPPEGGIPQGVRALLFYNRFQPVRRVRFPDRGGMFFDVLSTIEATLN
jgi:hypothetical protein